MRQPGAHIWTIERICATGALDGDIPGTDLKGAGLCAGWVDAHTHAVFAGDRASEFNRRLAGESYAEIAAKGGGILHTVTATREASQEALVRAGLTRVKALQARGARVVEIKTGYGLNLSTELKLLRAIADIKRHLVGQVAIVATAMPAHAIPPEHRADPDRYVRVVCDDILPAMASAVVPPDFVDVFIEKGYFDLAAASEIARAARRLGLPIKAHVDEFEDLGGVPWAIEHGATSVEHLLVTHKEHITMLGQSDTTAVCLPLTSLFLREPYAPMRAMVDAGCSLAIATDCNPGSAMSTNLHLALQLSVLRGGLTPQEALRAVTRGGAAALGGQRGPLRWDGALREGGPLMASAFRVSHPDHLFYELGGAPCAVSLA